MLEYAKNVTGAKWRVSNPNEIVGLRTVEPLTLSGRLLSMPPFDGQNETGARRRRQIVVDQRIHELALRTVTARRFCDQQEMSLQTATGRSLP